MAGSATITIKAKPGSRVEQVVPAEEGMPYDWLVKVKAPPVDGAANEAIIALLVKLLKVPKSSIELISGHTASIKRFSVPLSKEEVVKLLTA